MSEYIMDRKSLKRHCEAMCKKFKNVPTSGTYGEHRFVLNLLEQTEWIPVSESLPEEVGNYLTSIRHYGEERFVQVSFFDGISFKAEVEAWMPLPEPYKAESEG